MAFLPQIDANRRRILSKNGLKKGDSSRSENAAEGRIFGISGEGVHKRFTCAVIFRFWMRF
jgi:hypothetical protein